jgi:hypothetical protein
LLVFIKSSGEASRPAEPLPPERKRAWLLPTHLREVNLLLRLKKR